MANPFTISNGSYTIVDGAYTGLLRIDDFEDGNRAGWTVPSSTGGDTIVSPGLQGTNYAWQLDGFREGYLAGVDAVDRGPSPGDEFEYTFRVDDYTGSPGLFRFKFAASGVNDGDIYKVQYDLSGADPDVAVHKESGGSNTKSSLFKALSPAVGDIVHAIVRWNVGDSNIEVDHYLNGSFQHTVTISDTQYTQSGIALFVADTVIMTIDEILIVP